MTKWLSSIRRQILLYDSHINKALLVHQRGSVKKTYIKVENLRTMSFDRAALIRLYNSMLTVKGKLRWGSKKRLEEALKDWQQEDRLIFSQLREVMRPLINIEKI